MARGWKGVDIVRLLGSHIEARLRAGDMADSTKRNQAAARGGLDTFREFQAMAVPSTMAA